MGETPSIEVRYFLLRNPPCPPSPKGGGRGGALRKGERWGFPNGKNQRRTTSKKGGKRSALRGQGHIAAPACLALRGLSPCAPWPPWRRLSCFFFFLTSNGFALFPPC